MERKRKLPPKVHEKKGRYYYVDKNKWHGLSRVADGTRELYRCLAKFEDASPNSMKALFASYADSKAFKRLRPDTREQYEYFLFGILEHRFGHMMPQEITQQMIAMYLSKREEEGAPVAGNRERSCLSSVFVFAMRQGLSASNPCLGVPRNRETSSEVDIDSKHLARTLDDAPDHFARAMQLAYITGIRATDLRALKVSDVTPDGLAYTESKTGKRVLMTWTPTLRGLVREILQARSARMNAQWADPYKQKNHPRKPIVHDFLLVNRLGKPLTKWGISSNMTRLGAGFSFRNLRPKAQTDAGERNVLGHVGQMRERYTRRRRLVPVR